MEKEKCCETKAKDWWVVKKKKYSWEQMRIQKKIHVTCHKGRKT